MYWGAAWAEIDLDAVTENARRLKEHIGPNCELLAVVKANGYGHGAVVVARAALAGGASRLGVAYVEEGSQLRLAGIAAPILVQGYMSPEEAKQAVEHRLSVTVVSEEVAVALSRASVARGEVTAVHLKVDTGMGRYGQTPDEIPNLAEKVSHLPGLKLEGLYTHFATADEGDKGYTYQQFETYLRVLKKLEEMGVAVPCCHVANTAATLDLPQMHLDMVRCGIAIYGLYPSKEVARSVALRPALTLKSRVARLFSLLPGDTIGYGRTFKASRPSKFATIAIGYADGLQRILSNRGEVLIRGKRAPLVGRVSMDLCVAEVTHIPDVSEGDEVIIIGQQGEEEITADGVAERAGTISYEILCGIGTRVSRLYKQNGRLISRYTPGQELVYL